MAYINHEQQQQTRAKRRKVRVPEIIQAKGHRLLSCITCYDATFARLVEYSDMDIVLVGDSLGHVVQGKKNTLNVRIEDVAYHTKAVAASLRTPLLVADMPFCSSGLIPETTYKSAELLMRAGAEAVKIEGATPQICEQISVLVKHGIPVMGHIGLQPQSVHTAGGYRLQGREDSSKERLIGEAKALFAAGCFSLVLEMTNYDTAADITRNVNIPTIGIGAGPECDGQILVIADMLGMNLDFQPKYVKQYAHLETIVIDSINDYCYEVRERKFPFKGSPNQVQPPSAREQS